MGINAGIATKNCSFSVGVGSFSVGFDINDLSGSLDFSMTPSYTTITVTNVGRMVEDGSVGKYGELQINNNWVMTIAICVFGYEFSKSPVPYSGVPQLEGVN